MPSCGSRNCAHCFPPGAEKRAALEYALDRIDYGPARKTADDVLGWNSDDYWTQHEQPWFVALLAAFHAGVKAARDEVAAELECCE